MVENTDGVRRKPADPARLDETDRKLLGLLAEDSTRSYAELGRLCISRHRQYTSGPSD
jgi:Lrp/AsnC family leucine-responsive transcriptional regulator